MDRGGEGRVAQCEAAFADIQGKRIAGDIALQGMVTIFIHNVGHVDRLSGHGVAVRTMIKIERRECNGFCQRDCRCIGEHRPEVSHSIRGVGDLAVVPIAAGQPFTAGGIDPRIEGIAAFNPDGECECRSCRGKLVGQSRLRIGDREVGNVAGEGLKIEQRVGAGFNEVQRRCAIEQFKRQFINREGTHCECIVQSCLKLDFERCGRCCGADRKIAQRRSRDGVCAHAQAACTQIDVHRSG